MSQKSLYDLLHRHYNYYNVVDDYDEPLTNKQLRDKYPSVKDAWKQYKMLLALVRTKEEDNEEES